MVDLPNDGAFRPTEVASARDPDATREEDWGNTMKFDAMVGGRNMTKEHMRAPRV